MTDHRQSTKLDPDVLAVIRREGPMGEEACHKRLGFRRVERQDLRYALLRLRERRAIRPNARYPNRYEVA